MMDNENTTINNNNDAFKLSGFVSEFPLIEIIQFLGMTEKNGMLRIFNEEREDYVSLYFNGGRLVHAVSRESEGIDPFYMVLNGETGYFKFVSNEQPEKVTIDTPINILLLEHQRRNDELKHLETKLPPDDLALYIVPNLAKVPPLNTYEWRIISMCNGRRTIKRICEKIGDQLTTKKAILNLLHKKVISTVSENEIWKSLIPILLPSSELKSDRPYPPLLRTNLLLKAINGRSRLKDLELKLNMNENDLLEDVKLLYDTQWLYFSRSDEDIFTRLKGEI
jgi:hypothetical protein